MKFEVLAFDLALWLGICQSVTAFIHKLSDVEYDRLPPLFKLDEYGRCLRARSARYCYVTARLFGHNELFKTIQEYSADTKTHYDHTYLYRGVCVQSSCGEYLENSTDLTTAIEACLNETMTRDYQLTTRVVRSLCSEYSEGSRWDETDYAFGVAILVFLGLNALGSVYGYFAADGKKSFGGKLLYSFSVKRNWGQLVAPNSDVKDPMLRRLKCLYCFRTICTLVVLLAHSPLSLLMSNNPHWMESTYDHLPYHILYCGTVIVQTFFLVSGFLMAYNMLTAKSHSHWWMLPKKVLLRWLRLTPPYALVMCFVMSWARHIGDGPLWKVEVEVESEDCRRDWWLHLLYIHNYVNHSQCMAHAWYLAADMQLSVLGLVIFCVWSGARARKVAVALAFLVGLATPAVHMVLQGLNPIVVVSPEMALNFFVEDATFNNLYKRGHTNLVCYAMGMGLAFIVHNVKESDIGSDKYKKFRLLYLMAGPLELLTIISGVVFYMPDVQVPLPLAAVYASAIKTVFGLIVSIHIFFTIVKVERACRSFFHWGGWAVLARLSYCAYIVHVSVIRTSAAASDVLTDMSLYNCILDFFGVVVASFLLAAPMYLLVEAPIGHVVKLTLDTKKCPSTPPPIAANDMTSSKETVEIKL